MEPISVSRVQAGYKVPARRGADYQLTTDQLAARNSSGEFAPQWNKAAVSGEKYPSGFQTEDQHSRGGVGNRGDKNQIRGDKQRNQDTGSDELNKLYGSYECQTCKKRKYQDGSNDPGVSFKTPQSVSPRAAASAVRGHEMEHVFREQAKAMREGREVVSQNVVLHTGICPECGGIYVSGGTTRTVTRKSGELAEILHNEQLKAQRAPQAAQTAAAV